MIMIMMMMMMMLQVEDVEVIILFSRNVRTVNIKATIGTAIFDEATKVVYLSSIHDNICCTVMILAPCCQCNRMSSIASSCHAILSP